MKIAVIGAGLSGLAAAWLLSRAHRVTLYERHARPGFTAHSVSVPGRGGPERVDVPLRVFYPGYYPTLVRLYRALGVPSEPVSYATSFFGDDGELYFRYRNLRLRDRSFGYLAPADLLIGPRALRVLGGLLGFHGVALPALRRGALAGLTIGEFVERERIEPAFVDGFLLPAIATICTCPYAHARAFPAEVVVDYLARGLSREAVRRARHGADDVERRLLAGIPGLRCNARISAIRREAGGVVVRHEDGAEERHDHAVLATQANQALRLLADARAGERRVLEAFRYQPVEVVTHGDTALLPRRERDWSPVNLWVSRTHDVPESTIWINAVQPAMRGAAPVFQTVHPLREPRADAVFGRACFERPVVDHDSRAALQGLQALHGEAGRRVWFCGSYAQEGIPLLETAVRSAAEVAARFDAGLDQPRTAPNSA